MVSLRKKNLHNSHLLHYKSQVTELAKETINGKIDKDDVENIQNSILSSYKVQ